MKFSEAFNSHTGKYSDKWSKYLNTYDLALTGVDDPKTILEIGVQNGGSLEIWNELYPNSETILGVDIDQRCAELVFKDSKIRVIVGDADTDEVFNHVTKLAKRFDIVVDDGSHKSEDIIATLNRYLPTLKPGAIYLIEDLHASYWSAFGGSLFRSDTALAYLKRIIDVINVEHWNQDFTEEEILSHNGSIPSREFIQATRNIFEVRFFDSIAVIRMAPEFQVERSQFRVSAGDQSLVSSEPKVLVGTKLTPPQESRNASREHGLITSDEYLKLKRELTSILESRSWRWTSLIRKLASIFRRT